MKLVRDISANPAFTEAVRYWEPRRVLYNLILAAIAAIYIFDDRSRATGFLNFDQVLMLVFFAVAANVLYCTAYVVDAFLQHTEFSSTWRRFRGILFVLGTVVAMILTRFVSEAMF